MILDERLEFGDALAVTGAAAAAALIGDVIDLGEDGLDVGLGEDIYFVITTDTEIITAGNAGSTQFDLMSDSTANLATSPTTHFSTGALVTDDAAVNDSRLNAGGVIAAVKLPVGTYERYLGIKQTITTTEITAGKINAFLTKDFSKWYSLANAVGA